MKLSISMRIASMAGFTYFLFFIFSCVLIEYFVLSFGLIGRLTPPPSAWRADTKKAGRKFLWNPRPAYVSMRAPRARMRMFKKES
ncbi:hypothetical protein HMPREF3034_00828 [Prevotella sp. DNF00663]|nr:hypothetical protein HMPREF3034_00828 [Prevotella sp. DNF00663]